MKGFLANYLAAPAYGQTHGRRVSYESEALEMQLNRKQFFRLAGSALAATSACRTATETAPEDPWETIRAEFDLAADYVHLACLFMASHPRAVREAVSRYREELDANPVLYLEKNNQHLDRNVREVAGAYLGADPDHVALTDSTTMGIGLMYNGVKVSPGQELLTTEHDYYSTHASLHYKSAESRVPVRKIRLYKDLAAASEEEIVSNIRSAIRPETRVLALTWVHSSTGLKLPVRKIAEVVAQANAGRKERDRLLLGVDGVHAFGVEDFTVGELGCDFFMAGTHKWLFGPRGTGIVWAHPRAHSHIIATIPTFSRHKGWGPWMTPGGFQAFEHRWAVREAFEFHQKIGKRVVRDRIHALNTQLKEGLAAIPKVRLHTPMPSDLSAGIVCFDIDGMSPEQVVIALLEKRIIATETPYEPSHARMSPGLINSSVEIQRAVEAVDEVARSRT